MQNDRLSSYREAMVHRAADLLREGSVARVLGWARGDAPEDPSPAVFRTAQELAQNFVYNDYCGANLSKYLIALGREDGRTLVFLKPCDSYSLNQLLTEHRVSREKVFALAVPCEGMLDRDLVWAAEEDAVPGEGCSPEGGARARFLEERCLVCDKTAAIYDELLVPDADRARPPQPPRDRFARVRELEGISAEQRYAFWRGELSRCVRCNACRNVCPACSCEKCVFDNPSSGVAGKSSPDSFEEQLFHIIRAFHVAGRCTDCGECSRVCPAKIPLHLLNRKLILDSDRFFGEYTAGAREGSVSPLTAFDRGDPEPGDAPAILSRERKEGV